MASTLGDFSREVETLKSRRAIETLVSTWISDFHQQAAHILQFPDSKPGAGEANLRVDATGAAISDLGSGFASENAEDRAVLSAHVSRLANTGSYPGDRPAFLRQGGDLVMMEKIGSTATHASNHVGKFSLILARRLPGSVIAADAKRVGLSGLRLLAPSHRAATQTGYDLSGPSGRVSATLETTRNGAFLDEGARSTSFGLLAVLALACALLTYSLLRAILQQARQSQNTLRLKALFDAETGLSSAVGFSVNLVKLIREARSCGQDVVLLYLDLDDFRKVNESYGNAVGDTVIKTIAGCLTTVLPQGALLGRIKGDEFAIALRANDGALAGCDCAQAIAAFFAKPQRVGARIIMVEASVGMVVSPSSRLDGEEVMRRAKLAMRHSKEIGPGSATFFDPDMDALQGERMAMETDLRRAIEKQEISIAFQPVVDSQSRVITGVEALARWERHGYGPVRPDIFIAAAEQSGLIQPLGLFILRRTCEQAKYWPGIDVAVNVSPAQFGHPGFISEVITILSETGINPGRVIFEVTEGYFIRDPERARDMIAQLKEIGIRVALDDFGSGFSSVGYLRQFSFDRIKIDRSLVERAALETGGRELLQATVALARSLDLPVTAEGIECEEQALVVRLCGCDELQGYYIGRPGPAEAISAFIENSRTGHAAHVG